MQKYTKGHNMRCKTVNKSYQHIYSKTAKYIFNTSIYLVQVRYFLRWQSELTVLQSV